MRIGAGRFKNRALPRPHGARPVSSRLRTSLMSHLGARLEGARVLDLCAGVGGLGLEALSRGAAHVTLVELDRIQAAALSRFIADVGADDEAEVLVLDVRRRVPPGPFDLVFVDPPFAFWDDGSGTDLVGRAAKSLRPGGILAVKHPRGVALEAPGSLSEARRTAVASVAYTVFHAEP